MRNASCNVDCTASRSHSNRSALRRREEEPKHSFDGCKSSTDLNFLGIACLFPHFISGTAHARAIYFHLQKCKQTQRKQIIGFTLLRFSLSRFYLLLLIRVKRNEKYCNKCICIHSVDVAADIHGAHKYAEQREKRSFSLNKYSHCFYGSNVFRVLSSSSAAAHVQPEVQSCQRSNFFYESKQKKRSSE